MIGDAVFEEKAGWRGATKENTRMGLRLRSNEARGPFPQKSLGTAGLLARSFVVATVVARWGDTPVTPPRSRPKSLAAAPRAF